MKLFRGVNPYKQGSLIFDRIHILQREKETVTSDASAKEKTLEIQEFIGSEPQMMQRATENLVMLEDISAMQNSLLVIFTQDTELEVPTKGMTVLDTKTETEYRILAYYRHTDGYDLITSESSN